MPSQYGLLLDAPHLHIAAKTLPSTTIRLGPFGVHLITTLAITQMYSDCYTYSFPKIKIVANSIVPLDQIVGGGPPHDGIPSIDNPKFVSAQEANEFIEDVEFVRSKYQWRHSYPYCK